MDGWIRAGASPQPLPFTLGSELSGEIVAAGQGVSDQVLRRGGKLISTVSRPDQHLAQSHGIEAAYFLVNVTSHRLAQIANFLDGGTLRTRVGRGPAPRGCAARI